MIDRGCVAATVLALATAVGCATTTPPPPQLPADGLVTLRPGQTSAVAGGPVLVRFDGVDNDSRCPADAAGIQAGAATVKISVIVSDGRRVYELRTPGGAPVAHGALTISVEQLDPPPVGSRPIRPADYRLTLRLR